MTPHLIIEPAIQADAPEIAAVHVAAWRSAYANILPATYLATLSLARHTAIHRHAIATGRIVLVARDVNRQIVGFCTAGRPRTPTIAESEVETLYVLDDFRDQGIGRSLLRQAAETLAAKGCKSLFLWVLQDNPSRWFYERLAGRPTATSPTRVAGKTFTQTAYLWNPITTLLK